MSERERELRGFPEMSRKSQDVYVRKEGVEKGSKKIIETN